MVAAVSMCVCAVMGNKLEKSGYSQLGRKVLSDLPGTLRLIFWHGGIVNVF